jgi:hypothetical protein
MTLVYMHHEDMISVIGGLERSLDGEFGMGNEERYYKRRIAGHRGQQHRGWQVKHKEM